MSILLGPFDKSDESTKCSANDKEFLVFGYQCRLYRDDDKATMENEGQLLIPWMGDKSLMVDRYDVRNRFDDKSQFGLKSNLPQRYTEEEEEFERLLDEERYLALGTDIDEEELQREEEQKRMNEVNGDYNAVEFSYNSASVGEKERGEGKGEEPVLFDQPQMQEHLSTSYADQPEDGGEYERPFRLFLPPNIITPLSQKLHAVIERTALFISKQGQQMEIIIKTKQRYNPSFSFLHHEDRLFPYYKHLLNSIKNGSYQPQPPKETATKATDNNDSEGTKLIDDSATMKENLATRTLEGPPLIEEGPHPMEDGKISSVVPAYGDDSDSEEEEFELHPILRADLNPVVKPKTSSADNKDDQSSSAMETTDVSKFKSRTFKSIAFTINSAPSVTEESVISNGTSNPSTTTTATNVTTNESNRMMSVDVPTPGYTLCNNGYDPMLAYYQASQMYHTRPVPPPPDIQPIVDKTAEYVAKNGDKFEVTIILKHLSDSKFGFLHPWNQYNHYYKTKVSEFKETVKAAQENVPTNMQKLSNSGAVSFKMSVKVSAPGLSAGANMGVDNEEEEEEEGGTKQDDNDGTTVAEPPDKKAKMSEEDELMMDSTVKRFLLTVKHSF